MFDHKQSPISLKDNSMVQKLIVWECLQGKENLLNVASVLLLASLEKASFQNSRDSIGVGGIDGENKVDSLHQTLTPCVGRENPSSYDREGSKVIRFRD
jgi:hypothetical protein